MNNNPILARTVRIKISPDQLPESSIDDSGLKAQEGDAQESHLHEKTGESFERERTPEYKKLLKCIYDAVLITDRQGWVVEFNHRAEALFLRNAYDIEGRRIDEFVSGLDDSALSSICKELEPERFALLDASCEKADGTSFPSEVAVNRIDLFPDGHLCFFVRDITERKQAEKALEEAVVRLKAHDEARSQFVSNVSHELRTPLTSMIYAIANMLKGVVGPLSDHARRYVEMLEGDSKRLLTTVNDILDLRKLESGSLVLNRRHIRFLPFVKRSVESLYLQAQQKSVSLIIEEGAEQSFVNCDAQKMERVILNIVRNAIKFTDTGGNIIVSVDQCRNQKGWICLSITDDGVGIPPEALPHVMERYFTVGSQPDGSGVGLAISSEIVELHGGEMEILSPLPSGNSGTQVNVFLEEVNASSILLAGEETIYDSILPLLSGCGYNLISASTHRNIISMIESASPGLLILDMEDADFDAEKITEEIKSNRKTAGLPVLTLTSGVVEREKADKMMNFGIPMVSRSSDPETIIEKIEQVMFEI